MLNLLKKINVRILKIAEIIIKAIFVIMTSILIIDVSFRFILNSPLTWAEELARYLLVWVSCLGGGIIMGEHIKIEIILNHLPHSIKRWFLIVADILVIALLLSILIVGIPKALALRSITSAALPGVTMFWVFLAFPCFALIGTIHGLNNLFENTLIEK